MTGTSRHDAEFVSAIETNAPRYNVGLSKQDVERLRDYYVLVNEWNARLHLVAPCSPTEFATRHALESLLALPFLAPHAHVLDIGSGAGLPVIPCLIARSDLRATLFESSPKKAVFLREALRQINASGNVIAKRFEESATPAADFVTCRALDRFSQMFQTLVAWSPLASTLLLFGGPAIQQQIEAAGFNYEVVQAPESKQRFLFVVKKPATNSNT